MFNNYNWHGRRLEVREDRYAGSGGGSRGNFGDKLRGGLTGGYVIECSAQHQIILT